MPIEIDNETPTDADSPSTPAEPIKKDDEVSSDLFSGMFTSDKGAADSLGGDIEYFPDARPTEPAPPADDAGTPPVTEVPDKENPDRFQYQQARADRAEAELKKLQSELEGRRAYDPLLNVIREDDEAYRYLAQKVGGQHTPPKEEAPQPPSPPARPTDFNSHEAVTNPESPSWKYREEYEQYRDARVEYLEKQNEMRVRELQDSLTQQQEAAQRVEQTNATKQELMRVHGMDGAMADDFITTMAKPESVTLPNLVMLYKIQKQQLGVDNKNTSQEAAKRMVTPLPPGGGGAPPTPPAEKDPNVRFNQSVADWDPRFAQRRTRKG
jgi:hypothetical protein